MTQLQTPPLDTTEAKAGTSIVAEMASKLETPIDLASNRRNGKIARLPKPTRDMINQMIDDGIPYPVIIDELGEAGEGLNTQNLCNWKQGGYQDWLKQKAFLERAKAQMEAAVDLLRETKGIDTAVLHQACSQVAALQMLDIIMEHGEELLARILKANPAKYMTLLNIIVNLADSSLRFEKHRRAQTGRAPAALTQDQA